ncbi:MAG TPA: glycoside hydrolase family 19 protein [Pedomonas sp.]|uniref:glycoside hydrolase family 19 protein n=1 Tax=Pedomonas sp. TaxID=2976421 RepID=UPI002F422589
MIPARQIFAAQANLAKAGYEPGTIDGLLGPRTLAAWCSYIVGRQLGALGLLLGTAMAGDFRRFDIVTPLRMAHFLAQAAHETGGFRHFVELGSGDGPDPDPYDDYLQRYDYRRDLGNSAAGDGERYRGRGIFQLTGKANYWTYSKRVGIDLINQPERAAEPELAVLIACLFWADRKLNAIADDDALVAITRRINGGTNGLADRQARLARAKTIWELSHDRLA